MPVSAEPPPDLERIGAWLARVTKRPGPFPLALIPGGASPRRFYRTEVGGVRAVVMLVPPDTGDVAFARERGRRWPFLEVRELLARSGVRVPSLLAESVADELLLVEDLGDTLATYLEHRPGEREPLYRLAVRDLARAQAALGVLPEDSVVRLRAFDAALFRSELEHFWEWGVAARAVSAPHAPFERARDYLVNELTTLPRGFTHRDYQSRNLVVTTPLPSPPAESEPVLGWIDFQDALLGPRAYDLVALLCDSYQPFERAFVEARLDDYAAASGLTVLERRELGREFDLLTVQRKLKDAGRFVFIEKKRGDPSFLPFIRPTLAIVLDALARLHAVPELQALEPVVKAARDA